MRDIAGALTTDVLCQYLSLWEFLRTVALDNTSSDRFVWRWSADGTYSASSTYRAFFHGLSSLLGAKELWRARVPPKLKFFFWLALHGRLWTAERRRRHGLQDSDTCALCDQDVESITHLVLGCVFSRELWFLLLSPLGLLPLMPIPGGEQGLGSWWLDQRERLDHSNRSAYDSMLILLAWTVWKERNNRVFDRASRSPTQLFAVIVAEVEDWISAGFVALSPAWALWSQNSTAV